MAFVQLKNEGLTDNDSLDFNKTKTVRLASERINDRVWRQVHYVVFTRKSGGTVAAITVNDASHDECSESGVDVYAVAKYLGK